MRLGDFLSAARPAPHKPVNFRIIGKGADGSPVTADVDAVFVFVDETERQKARMEALAALKSAYPAADPPQSVVSDEITYHLLYRALRDSSDVALRVPFAESVTHLKNALVYKTAAELDEEYNAWVDAEFPANVTPEEFAELRDEAKKKSLSDLLSEFGFYKIRRALPSLVAVSGT